MKTDKIEEAMNIALEAVSVGFNSNDTKLLEVSNWLIGTLFHAYCSLEKLSAEKELLEANARIAKEDAGLYTEL